MTTEDIKKICQEIGCSGMGESCNKCPEQCEIIRKILEEK